jgi:transposase-like protein
MLFVVDGGKAIAKAVDDVYGSLAVIQRCRRHKERNILDICPRPSARSCSASCAQPGPTPTSPKPARTSRRSRAVSPDSGPGAAASLREGLDDTLTVNRLGVTGSLLKTVDSTNSVESMIEIVRDHSRRVKRWSSAEMALRWAAAGMHAAQTQFRRVKGFRQLPALARALEQHVGNQPDTRDIQHAATA